MKKGYMVRRVIRNSPWKAARHHLAIPTDLIGGAAFREHPRIQEPVVPVTRHQLLEGIST